MVRTYSNKRNLRYYIEDFLGTRIHFFEDGFKLNMKFIKWKLKYYFGFKLSMFKFKSILDFLCCIIYFILIPFIIISILLTPFLTDLYKRQKYCLMDFKNVYFGIHDPNDPYDYYFVLNHIDKKTYKSNNMIN